MSSQHNRRKLPSLRPQCNRGVEKCLFGSVSTPQRNYVRNIFLIGILGGFPIPTCSFPRGIRGKMFGKVQQKSSFPTQQSNGENESLENITTSTVDDDDEAKRDILLDGVFDDKLFDDQRWVFDMIDLGPVWSQGIFGKGVRVRINDAGIDDTNPEFEGRYDYTNSCPQIERNRAASQIFHDDLDFDPYQHGTSVASIIGAAGNNGECAVGIAPETTLSWCDGLADDESFLEFHLDAIDISQNSYERDACKPFLSRNHAISRLDATNGEDTNAGDRRRQSNQECPFAVSYAEPCNVCEDFSSSYYFENGSSRPKMSDECVTSIVKHCNRYFKREELEGTGACSDFLDLIIGGECSYDGLSTTARKSISKGIQFGRNGLGIIFVFASGNAYYEGDDTNLKGYTTSRHTITVGAVGKDGTHAYYSTSGASLFLSAPAGDSEDQSKHMVAQAGGGCTATTIGTSFASPVVSGVVALVLEVNRSLSWRDVQGILADSAIPVRHDSYDPTQTVNGAGMWHSNRYGFGIVNAHRAIEMAKTWKNYGEEKVLTVDSGLVNYPIQDFSHDTNRSTSSSLTISLDTPENMFFIVESVEILLDVVHISRGDLRIKLTSPSGTESILHPGKLPENQQRRSSTPEDDGRFWKLMTVRNREESPFGEWTLTITDVKAGQFEECVDLPDFLLYYDEVKVDCKYLEEHQICGGADVSARSGGRDGNRLNRQYSFLDKFTDDYGKRVTDACCICGGGMERESLGEDHLRHWTIAVYGRLDPSAFETLSPTQAPAVDLPTQNPTKNSTTSSSLPSFHEGSIPPLFGSDITVTTSMPTPPSLSTSIPTPPSSSTMPSAHARWIPSTAPSSVPSSEKPSKMVPSTYLFDFHSSIPNSSLISSSQSYQPSTSSVPQMDDTTPEPSIDDQFIPSFSPSLSSDTLPPSHASTTTATMGTSAEANGPKSSSPILEQNITTSELPIEESQEGLLVNSISNAIDLRSRSPWPLLLLTSAILICCN